jgi:hypothetical protein
MEPKDELDIEAESRLRSLNMADGLTLERLLEERISFS